MNLLLRKAVLCAAAVFVPVAFGATPATQQKTAAAKPAAAKPAAGKKAVAPKGKKKAVAAAEPEDKSPGTLADLGDAEASADVKHVANWVSYTHNAKKKAFVIIDKKNARMFVFDPKGKLRSDSPVLLGKAVGDDSVPGIGNKPMSQIREEEKTTPAGRFLAQRGKNTHGDDIIWIDYNAAVSMHRMRKVSEEEHRAERMATPDVSDNRISYGCVNVPAKFYDAVLKPTVVKYGAYIYVLPETRSVEKQFGSYDVTTKTTG